MLLTELNAYRSKTDETNKSFQRSLQNVSNRLNTIDVDISAANVEGVRMSNKFDSSIALIRNEFQILVNRLVRHETKLTQIVATTESIDRLLTSQASNAAPSTQASPAPFAAAGYSTNSVQAGNLYPTSSGALPAVAQIPVANNFFATATTTPQLQSTTKTSSVPLFQGTNPSSAQYASNPADPNYVPPLLRPGTSSNPAGETSEYSELDRANMKPADHNHLKAQAIKSITTKFKPPKTLAEVHNMNNIKSILTYESSLTQLKNQVCIFSMNTGALLPLLHSNGSPVHPTQLFFQAVNYFDSPTEVSLQWIRYANKAIQAYGRPIDRENQAWLRELILSSCSTELNSMLRTALDTHELCDHTGLLTLFYLDRNCIDSSTESLWAIFMNLGMLR
jgi:hypothetical protein